MVNMSKLEWRQRMFFSNMAKNLEISQYSNFNSKYQRSNFKSNSKVQTPLKYSYHWTKYKSKIKFSFTKVTTQGIETFDLETKKASKIFCILTKIIKENVDIFADFLSASFSSSIKSYFLPVSIGPLILFCFRHILNFQMWHHWKHAKQNFRLVSILPILSTIHERHMFKQMSSFTEI